MSINWQNCVCQNCSQQVIGDINAYIDLHSIDYVSPIDMFYKTTKELLRLGTPSTLSEHPIIGNLLLIGLISSTEKYIRDLFSGIVKICPISLKQSCEQSVNLGSVLWLKNNIEDGIFENISFAGFEHVTKASKKFIGHDIRNTSLTYKMLKEFDQVCQMRHCVVHVNSFFAAKNAINLGIDSSNNIIKVKVSFDTFQECLAICTNLVVSLNIEYFEVISNRWATSWRNEPSWVSANDSKRFDSIWTLFYSETDCEQGNILEPMSKTKCKNAIKRIYSL